MCGKRNKFEYAVQDSEAEEQRDGHGTAEQTAFPVDGVADLNQHKNTDKGQHHRGHGIELLHRKIKYRYKRLQQQHDAEIGDPAGQSRTEYIAHEFSSPRVLCSFGISLTKGTTLPRNSIRR